MLYITIFANTSSLKVGPTTMEGQGNPAESQLIFFYNFLDDDGDDGDDERYLWYLDGVIRPLVADFPWNCPRPLGRYIPAHRPLDDRDDEDDWDHVTGWQSLPKTTSKNPNPILLNNSNSNNNMTIILMLTCSPLRHRCTALRPLRTPPAFPPCTPPSQPAWTSSSSWGRAG